MRGESSLANSFSREEALPTECFDFDFSSGVALNENNPQRHPVMHDVASKSGSLKGGEGIVTSQSANVCKREKKVEEWSGREGREGKPATDRFGESVLLFHLTSQKIKRPSERESQFKRDLFSLCNRKRNRAGTFLRDGRPRTAVISSVTSTNQVHDAGVTGDKLAPSLLLSPEPGNKLRSREF